MRIEVRQTWRIYIFWIYIFRAITVAFEGLPWGIIVWKKDADAKRMNVSMFYNHLNCVPQKDMLKS